jgi:hypothetical protein
MKDHWWDSIPLSVDGADSILVVRMIGSKLVGLSQQRHRVIFSLQNLQITWQPLKEGEGEEHAVLLVTVENLLHHPLATWMANIQPTGSSCAASQRAGSWLAHKLKLDGP